MRPLSPTDHPRSRGEYGVCGGGTMPLGGSSPLSRGILRVVGGGVVRPRIIPALAGNTGTTILCCVSARDHPRSRGEYLAACFMILGLLGSSPLSRGIHRHLPRQLRAQRIIPALAGNTCHGGTVQFDGPDHPRSRGEYCIGCSGRLGRLGSSPLSRGIRSRSRTRGMRLRIIPALAGNTLPYPTCCQ